MHQSEIIKLAKGITSLPKKEGHSLFLNLYGERNGHEITGRIFRLTNTDLLTKSEKKRIHELVAALRFVG